MHSDNSLVVVDGYVATNPYGPDRMDLRDKVWAYALDQRAFGPRQLLVAFADAEGTVLGFAWTPRAEPIDPSFTACLLHLGAGADAAVAYLDEPVHEGPAAPSFLDRFVRLRALAAEHAISLIDWISCDDDEFRSVRLSGAVMPDDDWWSVGSDLC